MQVDVRPALAVVHRTATLLALAVMLATAGGCRMQSLTDETLTSGAIGTPNGTLPGSGGHSQPSSDWIAAAVDAPSAMPVSAISSSTPTELPTPVLPKGTPTYAGAAVDFLRTPTAGMLPGVTDIYLRSGQSILIAKTDLNVRAGPGVDFEVLGYLTTAQWAVATGTNDDASWLRINVPSAPGRSGWVARNYVNVTDLAGLTEVAVPTLSPSATPTTTPTATPGATNTPETEAGWQGEYFDNISLDGEPVLVRTDSGIDFEWSDKAPADGLPFDGPACRTSAKVPIILRSRQMTAFGCGLTEN
jgi:hypothetical protein